jgi:hypothetical protein
VRGYAAFYARLAGGAKAEIGVIFGSDIARLACNMTIRLDSR